MHDLCYAKGVNISMIKALKGELRTPIGKVTLVLVFIAFLLAIIPFSHQLFFYYDQARDAYEAFNIWHNHDIKLLGPATDIKFLHHGALWYYLLAILYGVFQQNPLPVGLIFLIAIFCSLPTVWQLSHKLFHDKRIAYLSVIIYSFSPLFQLSSRWISNPVLSCIVMPFLLASLWDYSEKPSAKAVIKMGIFYGLVIQSQLAFGILLIFLPLYLAIFKIKPQLKHILLFSVSLGASTATIILGEIKYKFQGITSLIEFMTHSHKNPQPILSTLNHIIEKINDLVYVSSFSLPLLLPLILLLVLLLLSFRKKIVPKSFIFIGVWLSNLIIFTFFDTGISRSFFVFYPSVVLICILTAYGLLTALKKPILYIIVTIGIVFSQSLLSIYWISRSENPLTVQKGITFQIEKEILDYTYSSSHKKSFSINTITEPLFINTTWAYLYTFYGAKKYNYLPYWAGKDQRGNLGELPLLSQPTDYHYLIIEPTTGIPTYFINAAINEENARSHLIEEKRFGNFVVQKRQLLAHP